MAMFIFTGILMISLWVVLYLVTCALPRIADDPDDGVFAHRYSEIPEKIDVFINGFTFKFLRKLKVTTLKIDNSLSKHIERVKPEKGGEHKSGIDFKEISGRTDEGEEDDAE